MNKILAQALARAAAIRDALGNDAKAVGNEAGKVVDAGFGKLMDALTASRNNQAALDRPAQDRAAQAAGYPGGVAEWAKENPKQANRTDALTGALRKAVGWLGSLRKRK